MDNSSLVQSDPEIMGGTPVFVGTRVPFQTFIDYLITGHTVPDFLEDYPTVKSDVAIAALEEAKEIIVTRARAA